MPRSPEPARLQLLDTALRLFAARGIGAVSMREIRLAAKQRNAGALQYHFGTKEGLLRALLERELPPLVARRRVLLAQAAVAPPDDLRAVAAIFVLPFAELASGDPHDKSVVMLLSDLHDDVSLSFSQIMDLVGDTAIDEAAALLRARLKDIPDVILSERISVAHSIFLHAAAIRARGGSREQQLDDEAFSRNLVDMFCGALAS
ncbi:MAG: transcriptional regulator, TetR family [Rhodospirillales bacterium]|nr:transcriptional regulator, TetR family [Rhodospirillales bacterium]